MSKFAALLFDFDGVLIDSEYEGNRHLAEWLTANGHPHTPEEAPHAIVSGGEETRPSPLPATIPAKITAR